MGTRRKHEPDSELWKNTPIYEVIVDLRGFERITLEVGPLVPARCLWRLLGRSRQRMHRHVSNGRFRIISVMGERFVSVADVQKWKDGK